MRSIVLSLLIVLCMGSCRSVKTHNHTITKLHSAEALHEDVDKLYTQLKRNHPKLYQYITKQDLEFKLDSLKQSITTPLTSKAFYRKLAPVFATIRQGHLSLRPARKRYKKKDWKALKKKKFEFYELDFEYLDEKLWVKRTVGKDSSHVGAEVLRIDGTPVKSLIETYKTRFASDGYNTTLYNRAVGRFFKVFYVRDRGFLDSLEVTFRTPDSTYSKMFKRVSKKTKKTPKDTLNAKQDSLKPPTPKKKPSKADLKARQLAKKKKRKTNKVYGYISRSKEYTRNFKFIGTDSTVAYMKVRGFSNGNYKTFYKESFQKIKTLKTKHLIIDLRDNGGGRVAEVQYLYSFLTDQPFQFTEKSEVANRWPFLKVLTSNTTPIVVKSIATLLTPLFVGHSLFKIRKQDDKLYYNLRDSKLKQPHALHFDGEVYVLINGNSFSASSLIATHLKATQRATFVGEETGGAYNGCVAGFYKMYELPATKLIARIGLMQLEAPYKQEPDGYGIRPDVEILPTAKDRAADRDVELEWILKNMKH